MNRTRKILLWTVGIVVGVPFVVVMVLLIALNLSPGQRLVERQVGALTGGMVKIAGLSGRFPDRLHLDHIEVADAKGAWVVVDGVALDWAPSSLLFRRARIESAVIEHVAVARLPESAASAAPADAKSSGFSLPVSVDLQSLRIGRADIAAPVAGAAFTASLEAHAQVASLAAGQGAVVVTRLDGAGSYRADATLTDSAIAAHVTVNEPAGGLISVLGKLPALGGISVNASIDGPKSAERANIVVGAGDLHATLTGTADLVAQRLAVDLVAAAPAMRPGPGVAWDGIDIKAHVAGNFRTPDASLHLAIMNLAAGGASVAAIQADLTGNQGAARLHASLTGTRIPGGKPDLLAAAPVTLDADINLAAAGRPAHVKIVHPLLNAEAQAQTRGTLTARLHAILPDLAPLAAVGGTDVRGRADLVANVTAQGSAQHVTVTGTTTITGGQAPAPGLVGDGKLDIAALVEGKDLTLEHATIDGRALHLDAAGKVKADSVALTWHVGLPDLAVLSPQAIGALTLAGDVSGPPDRLTLNSAIKGEAGTHEFPKGPVALTLYAENLPGAPAGKLRGTFRLRDADVSLDGTATTGADGVLHAVLSRADWKSITTRADIAVPKSGAPTGKLEFNAGNLGDAAPFAGQPLGGSLKATLNATASEATVQLLGTNLAAGTRQIASLALKGRAAGLQSDPDLNGTLDLGGINADGVTGAAKVTAQGRQTAVQLRATTDLQDAQAAPAHFSTAALLNAKTKQVTLQTLAADWKTLVVRLQSPARVDFGTQIAVDRLNLALGQATLSVAGRASPTLDLTASLKNFTPDILQPLAPQLAAAGVLSADARLTGTPAAPNGVVRLNATGLRMKRGPAASIPPATIAATVALNGAAARIDAHVDAGPKLRFSAAGAAPLSATGALALRTNGILDLTLLDPVLTAQGRRATGRAGLDLAIAGTGAAPRITGHITLTGAEIQDFAQGLHLTKINADIAANGDSFTIDRFTAAAGPGTIAISGSVGALAPGLPVDLRITARNARPLASDLLTALFDADLTVRGQANAAMDASGKILLHRMEINIPDSLPPAVVVLNVRRPGQAPPPPPSAAPPAPPATVRLAIDVDAPSNIFVRGKGLYAEMGGTLKISGTSAAPLILGGFDMRRGDFSLAGTTLTFSRGRVSFNGASATGKIDPTLDFQADNYQGSIVASLKVTGFADAPKIALASVPDLPQDEILAHLLFGVSVKDLSPLQIAEIGAALAELAGATSGDGPLGSIRKGLGLDRLSVGGGSSGGATVEGGRYVAKGVYVGAKQTAGGAGGTQALVQIDITRHLKLNTTLGTGGGTAQGATPENDPGSSVGLSYQFEY